MKICIVSHSHDHREQLAAAVTEQKSSDAQAVLHFGDLEKMEFEIWNVTLARAPPDRRKVQA